MDDEQELKPVEGSRRVEGLNRTFKYARFMLRHTFCSSCGPLAVRAACLPGRNLRECGCGATHSVHHLGVGSREYVNRLDELVKLVVRGHQASPPGKFVVEFVAQILHTCQEVGKREECGGGRGRCSGRWG